MCIKQEYFEDQPSVIVKTKCESPPNQHHNIMQSIKVEVKEEEHYDAQDCHECVVKRELHFQEIEQTERSVKIRHSSPEYFRSITSGTSSLPSPSPTLPHQPQQTEDESVAQSTQSIITNSVWYPSGTAQVQPATLSMMSALQPLSNVQSTSGIKQEYFEGQVLVNVKTEPQSPPNQHNLLESIKVEVKEEVHYDEQNCRECVVKCELDYDEQMDTERPVKRQQSERMNGGDANDGQVNEKIKVIHLNCTEQNCQVKSNSLDQLNSHLLTMHGLFPLRCFAQNCTVRCHNCGQMAAHMKQHHTTPTQFVCHVCGKEFASQNETYNHWYVQHLTGQFECNLNQCTKVLVTRQKVRDHRKYKHNSERFECHRAGCSSSFGAKCDLARHELTHLDTRPFHCIWPHCNMRTNRRASLLTHIRTQHFGLPKSLKEQMEKKIEDNRDPNEYVRVVVQGDE